MVDVEIVGKLMSMDCNKAWSRFMERNPEIRGKLDDKNNRKFVKEVFCMGYDTAVLEAVAIVMKELEVEK
jgi:hypothetical protein